MYNSYIMCMMYTPILILYCRVSDRTVAKVAAAAVQSETSVVFCCGDRRVYIDRTMTGYHTPVNGGGRHNETMTSSVYHTHV